MNLSFDLLKDLKFIKTARSEGADVFLVGRHPEAIAIAIKCIFALDSFVSTSFKEPKIG